MVVALGLPFVLFCSSFELDECTNPTEALREVTSLTAAVSEESSVLNRDKMFR